jgi:selenocysteine-specific elongation factor
MHTDLILGTAGHIDHGKTSLIGALTGTNTDRLPEEKKRGITIELGYAHLDLEPYRLGIVDVPGHEKFVRQMLAGATGIDLALLVVAADDSVKQQTREHCEILRILDLPAGVIAITKSDLVEPDWLELVEEEVRQLVSDTFLKESPIVFTSSKTGAGMDELKSAIGDACAIAAADQRQNRISGPFRMAIDRTFTIAGHGTVVTGSVSSGRAQVGDQMEIQPGGHEVRIRGIQNHDSSSDEVHRGQRAAINLAGVHHNETQRGDELGALGHLVPTTILTVELFLLSSVIRPLKDRTRIRFHIGTAEIMAVVRLLDCEAIEPGQTGLAQLFLQEPAVATWNQPFVIRSESPVFTLGGGRVLHSEATRIKNPTELDLTHLNNMKSDEPATRAASSVFLSADLAWTPERLPRTAGVNETEQVAKELVKSNALREIKISASRNAVVHADRLAQLSDRVCKSLKRLHENNPLRFAHPVTEIENEYRYMNQPELVKLVIRELTKAKKVQVVAGSITLDGFGPKLSKGERALMEDIIAGLKAEGIETSGVKAIQKKATKNKDSVPQLLELASQSGVLVKVDKDYYLHSDVAEEIKAKLSESFSSKPEMTMSEIRDIMETTRKFAVPICEYLDSSGFTIREGDKRRLNVVEQPESE